MKLSDMAVDKEVFGGAIALTKHLVQLLRVISVRLAAAYDIDNKLVL